MNNQELFLLNHRRHFFDLMRQFKNLAIFMLMLSLLRAILHSATFTESAYDTTVPIIFSERLLRNSKSVIII